jgi:hypothetical protein
VEAVEGGGGQVVVALLPERTKERLSI